MGQPPELAAETVDTPVVTTVEKRAPVTIMSSSEARQMPVERENYSPQSRKNEEKLSMMEFAMEHFRQDHSRYDTRSPRM